MVDRPSLIDVTVPSEDLSYSVVVGPGMLGRVGIEVRRAHPRARKVALISDEKVMALHGGPVRRALEGEGLQVVPWTIPPGEVSKTPERMLHAVSTLVATGFGRNDAVVALGGGVVGDLAGLVAALFMRGVGFVQVPTSLLAQVDASVGGKVAVDLPQGKNLLGAFHFPRGVLIDPEVLSTLPDVELASGLAEMLKHGLLFSRAHVDALIEGVDAVFQRDPAVLGPLVAMSVALKAACVSRDPLEKSGAGKGRILLNLGHTVGHAIEAASSYALRHGEAVALGLCAAARISVRKGLAEPELESEVIHALERLRLPTDLDPWLAGDRGRKVERALVYDKKRAQDTITYIALAQIGEPRSLAMRVPEILGLLR
jgi:3-dehydroquinate synthase